MKRDAFLQWFLPAALVALGCGSSPAPKSPSPADAPKPAVTQAAPAANAPEKPATPAAAEAEAAPPPPDPCAVTTGAEACKACEGGDASSCTTFGALVMAGKVGRRDVRRAEALFRKACDANDWRACDKLGLMIGDVLHFDDAGSLSLFKKACDGGFAPACGHAAGMMLVTGGPQVRAEKKEDVLAAVALAEKACEGGHGNSCGLIGMAHYKGAPAPIKKSLALTKKWLERACDLGDRRDCAALSTFYEEGFPGEKPNLERAEMLAKKAFGLLQKSCTEDLDACDSLARYHETGFGTIKDQAAADEVRKNACEKGDSESCLFHGRRLENSKDLAGAMAFYGRACDDGSGSGCEQLGGLYFKGAGVPKDMAKAISLYDKGCTLGSIEACRLMGIVHTDGLDGTTDLRKGLEYVRLSCSNGYPLGCAELGSILYGQFVPLATEEEIHREALAAFTYACKEGNGQGCMSIAWLHEHGIGVPKSQAKALEYAKKGCALRYEFACEWLAAPPKQRPIPNWAATWLESHRGKP